MRLLAGGRCLTMHRRFLSGGDAGAAAAAFLEGAAAAKVRRFVCIMAAICASQ